MLCCSRKHHFSSLPASVFMCLFFTSDTLGLNTGGHAPSWSSVGLKRLTVRQHIKDTKPVRAMWEVHVEWQRMVEPEEGVGRVLRGTASGPLSRWHFNGSLKDGKKAARERRVQRWVPAESTALAYRPWERQIWAWSGNEMDPCGRAWGRRELRETS